MTALDTLVADEAAPLAGAADLDLVEVVVRGEGRGRLVRVVVDRKGGVDVEQCTRLSQHLGRRLDALAELDDGYRLEVTSPGVDYPLRDRRAFDRVEGRLVEVRATGLGGEPVQRRGTVVAAEADAVVLDVDGVNERVPYTDIVKATQSLPW